MCINIYAQYGQLVWIYSNKNAFCIFKVNISLFFIKIAKKNKILRLNEFVLKLIEFPVFLMRANFGINLRLPAQKTFQQRFKVITVFLLDYFLGISIVFNFFDIFK